MNYPNIPLNDIRQHVYLIPLKNSRVPGSERLALMCVFFHLLVCLNKRKQENVWQRGV